MNRIGHFLGAAALAVTVAAALTACGGSAPAPHSLSMDQAQQLALIRFHNYAAHTTGFTGTIPSPSGAIELSGDIDFTDQLGYATMRIDGHRDAASTGLLQWNPSALGFRVGSASTLVLPTPTDNWQVRQLQTTGSEFDGALMLLLGLASDRPDNPQLLQQSSALWLRSDQVDGVPVDVYQGPTDPDATGEAAQSRLRYWVDHQGMLLRIEARLGDDPSFATFTFHGKGARIDPIEALAPGD